MKTEEIKELNRGLRGADATEVISFFAEKFGDKIAFASSLGGEDQVITDIIAKTTKTTKIFTLDTGRLFPEAYDLIERTNEKYNIKIDLYFPNYQDVEKMVKERGINLFYESIEDRKRCCNLRKIIPLKRAFKGLEAWFCGLRQEQSVTRYNTNLVEWDEENGLLKINPLYNWTEDQVWDYINKHDVPYNVLHDRGYPSIGCQPCTRAVKPGEDIRSGRWWWEQPENKECGLHKR